jgi:hypothetical protein
VIPAREAVVKTRQQDGNIILIKATVSLEHASDVAVILTMVDTVQKIAAQKINKTCMLQ